MRGRPKSNKNEILRELILQFPKISKYALAEKAIDLYPTIFDNVEAVR